MTPSEVRNQYPIKLREFRDALIRLMSKKDLVLFNGFLDVPADEQLEHNLNTAIPSGEAAKYNILHSRVNIMLLDEDDESPTFNGYKSLNGEVSFAVKTTGRLWVKNNTTNAIRLSVFVSAARK